jgi:hypothetical protein
LGLERGELGVLGVLEGGELGLQTGLGLLGGQDDGLELLLEGAELLVTAVNYLV